MKTCIFLYFVIVAVRVISSKDEDWKIFKANHKKMYRSAVDDRVRQKIFYTNLRKITGHNKRYQKGEVSYELGVNRFADMTRDEFLDMLTLHRRFKPRIQKKNIFSSVEGKVLPESVNWTREGAVTEIKDQSICGSCWSFSTKLYDQRFLIYGGHPILVGHKTGSLEGQLFLRTGNLTSLSEQNLIDCVTDCAGCYGGFMDYALNYVQTNGIMREDEYPYEARGGKCRFQAEKSVTRISSLWYIKPHDELALQTAVAFIGPIAVAIDATGLQFYKSGIYINDFSCGNTLWNLNHGVLLVGYGTINGTEYWLVKNSWGESWGEQGYILMAKNRNNQCGIATDSLFPEL